MKISSSKSDFIFAKKNKSNNVPLDKGNETTTLSLKCFNSIMIRNLIMF